MSSIQAIIEKMQKEGAAEGEIAALVQVLTESAMMRATAKMLDAVSGSDQLETVGNIADDEAGRQKIAEVYARQTGRSINELAKIELEAVGAEYLQKLSENKTS